MTPPGTDPTGWHLSLARDLRPGDEITETDTPHGPTYTVTRVDTTRGLLVLDDVEIPLGPASAAVLARPATSRR